MGSAVQVQRRWGTAAEHAVFTGASREITVNTDTDRLHVHDGATQGGFPTAQLFEVGLLKLVLRAVNLNATGDTSIALNLPPGIANYRIDRVVVLNSTGALPSTAQLGLYTAASRGGVTIAAQQALSGITSQAANVSGNSLSLTLTNNNTTAFSATTLYVNVGTAQGSAATVDVIIFLESL